MPWKPHDGIDLSLVSASVLIVSDSLFSGESDISEDISGPTAIEILSDYKFESINLDYYPDDLTALKGKIENDISQNVGFILLIGGTGIGIRDVSTEAVRSVLKKELPGFGEEFRRRSIIAVGEIGLLSRAIAGISEKSLIVALPGSPNAVNSGLEILHPILPHILKLVRGN